MRSRCDTVGDNMLDNGLIHHKSSFFVVLRSTRPFAQDYLPSLLHSPHQVLSFIWKCGHSLVYVMIFYISCRRRRDTKLFADEAVSFTLLHCCSYQRDLSTLLTQLFSSLSPQLSLLSSFLVVTPFQRPFIQFLSLPCQSRTSVALSFYAFYRFPFLFFPTDSPRHPLSLSLLYHTLLTTFHRCASFRSISLML